jgi:hypothetical protein
LHQLRRDAARQQERRCRVAQGVRRYTLRQPASLASGTHVHPTSTHQGEFG